MQVSDASDQEKLQAVATAIAEAMGHGHKWRDYLTVARMTIAGYAACQTINRKRSAGRGHKRKSPADKPRF